VNQVRPADGSDNRFYNPSRDLAHCTVDLQRHVCSILEDGNLPPWADRYVFEQKISDEDITKVMLGLGQIITMVPDVSVRNVGHALDKLGSLPPRALLLCYALHGAAAFGMGFRAMKAVARPDDRIRSDVAALLEEAAHLSQARWRPRWLLQKIIRFWGWCWWRKI
jgi:hypothetical protein